MITEIIYFLGVIATIVLSIHCLIKSREKIILTDLAFVLFVSCASWISFLVILFITYGGDVVIYSKNHKKSLREKEELWSKTKVCKWIKDNLNKDSEIIDELCKAMEK